jgi:hypothetical protein
VLKAASNTRIPNLALHEQTINVICTIPQWMQFTNLILLPNTDCLQLFKEDDTAKPNIYHIFSRSRFRHIRRAITPSEFQ